MKNDLEKEIFNCIDVARESIKNNMDISLESYTEVLSKLDQLVYLIRKNSFKA